MKTKQILLACVIGLLPACKQQVNEPETLFKPANSAAYAYDEPFDNTPVDSFMKHVPNIENVKFYIPRENNSRIYFETNSANGDIYKMTEEHDVAQTNTNILYPVVLNRTDNQSVDGTASFVSETTWTLSVSYQTSNNETRTWSIEDIPASELDSYTSMSFVGLAARARDSILSRNPNETTHADSVWANIHDGRNISFGQNNPFTVQFNSKGAQQGLRHSDFGTITYTKGAVSETKMYSAPNMEDEIRTSVYNCPATSMNITAYANVKRIGTGADGQQLVLTTGKNAARYVIDEAHNETIVMPFQNWYTVTIIKTPGHLYSYMTDSANIVPSQWQFIHTDKVENEYMETILPNSLFAMVGSYEENDYSGFYTYLSRQNFLDPDGKVEVVGQGYREDYVESGDQIVMTFCFGGTDRVQEDPVTTGLEMIYCAPQR